mgnify:CR=1 FL=1
MSYLRFDKTLMTNLEESLTREILRTNRSGAYHCSTIVDCNTRKYHGLLVVPIPELGDENYVLLSSLSARGRYVPPAIGCLVSFTYEGAQA